MDILEKATKILIHPACNHCLGRQFAQVLSGYTNDQRGHLLRTLVAMSIDKDKDENKEASNVGRHHIDMSNFLGFDFHNMEFDKDIKPKTCSICLGFFQQTDKWAKIAERAARKCEFRTFLVGTKLSHEMIDAEEALWERVGIDFCEPIKAEINREVGKAVEKKLGVKFSKTPDVNIILNLANEKAAVEINPVFIYGEYQKLARGIPQTKWPNKKYKTSIEEMIAKPFMKASLAAGHKLHGLGREDIDARCLGWRPFVLELLLPRKRNFDIKKLMKKVDKRVRVRGPRLSDIREVRRIKESKSDKTYSMIVVSEKALKSKDLKKLKALSSIKQKTPQRVLHRRADKFRDRAVRSLKATLLSGKKFRLVVRCEAGLYVKELVSGDSGRTTPSISQILDSQCVVKELDIMAVHAK